MAFIDYLPDEEIPEADRVPDHDNILRIQGVHRRTIRRLRLAGFDDRGIHDTCTITAYFAFVNRIADGLGVEMESDR